MTRGAQKYNLPPTQQPELGTQRAPLVWAEQKTASYDKAAAAMWGLRCTCSTGYGTEGQGTFPTSCNVTAAQGGERCLEAGCDMAHGSGVHHPVLAR